MNIIYLYCMYLRPDRPHEAKNISVDMSVTWRWTSPPLCNILSIRLYKTPLYSTVCFLLAIVRFVFSTLNIFLDKSVNVLTKPLSGWSLKNGVQVLVFKCIASQNMTLLILKGYSLPFVTWIYFYYTAWLATSRLSCPTHPKTSCVPRIITNTDTPVTLVWFEITFSLMPRGGAANQTLFPFTVR